jgi:two-component system phosphate regulon sensor histidine kinase PhoR
MARLDEKKIELTLEALDGNELIREAIKNCSLPILENDGKIETELNASQSQIKVDQLHLTNIIYNLVDNAIKYNKGKPLIKISTYNSKSLFCIEVQDNGIGILPENFKKIFDRFYRVPTGNVHDVKGFGLGLNYVKLVVEAHNGTINLSSTLDSGTSFKISLPTL